MNNKNYLNLTILLIFSSYLILGTSIFSDYGISWDEYYHRINGFVSLNLVREIFSFDIYQGIEHEDKIFGDSTKHYGVIFDLPMAYFEKFFNISDPKNYFLLRHFSNFLIFYVSSIFFYLLLKIRFSNILSIIGLIFFILSPRIFAESFYNMKDVIFLSFFVISLYFAITFLNNPNYRNLILSALTCAFAIDSRVLGLIVPFIVIVFFTLTIIENKKYYKNNFIKLFVFVSLVVAFTIIFWPYLWNDPFVNFVTALKAMSSYPMRLSVFYFGDYVSSVNLPWHYPIVWIFITTPILYLILFLIGSFFIFYNFINRFLNISEENNRTDPWENNFERMDIIFFLIFYFTLFLVIQINATLYGGWRHLYFIYPCLIYMSVKGMENISKYFSIRYLLIIVIPFLAYMSFWMFKNHPYQFVYFNKFAEKNIAEKFELDYWGVSNKNTLSYISEIDNRNEIKIFINSVSPYEFSALLLDTENRDRLKFTNDLDEANYVVTNHYYQKGNPIIINNKLKKDFNLIKEIKVDNVPINSIYRIN